MFKLVEVTKEQALQINKPVFTSNEDVYLVHLKGTKEDTPCFTSEEDFKIIGYEQLKEFKGQDVPLVVNFKNAFPDQRKLEKLQEQLPLVRFTGANLIESEKVKLGVFSKEFLEKRLSCKIKDNKSFIYQELVKIVPFNTEMPIEDFKVEDVSIEGVRFGVVSKGKKSSKVKFKSVFKKKKPLFEDGRVEF